MTRKQEKFLEFYKETGDAAEAARRAGYREKDAAATGRRNLEKLKPFLGRNAEGEARGRETAETGKDDAFLMDIRSINEFWSRLASGEEKEEKAVYNSDKKQTEIVRVNPALKDRLKASELRAKALAAPGEEDDAAKESRWFK